MVILVVGLPYRLNRLLINQLNLYREKMDAIDVFYPIRMAERILGMGDVVSLVERAQEQFDEEEARKIQKKIAKK
jgi:signal recognition particle GTPase